MFTPPISDCQELFRRVETGGEPRAAKLHRGGDRDSEIEEPIATAIPDSERTGSLSLLLSLSKLSVSR